MPINSWGPPKVNLARWLTATTAAPGVAADAPQTIQLQSPVPSQPGQGIQNVKITEFPRHLYPPRNVKTIDMRIVRSMDPGEVFDMINFNPKALGIYGTVFFTHYAVFNDGLLESDYSFLPTLNGNRIYPYHGNPQNTRAPGTFLISLGLAPDEANYALIPGFFIMNPEDTYVWQVTNGSTVETDMGVRVVGYVDESSKRTSQIFGG